MEREYHELIQWRREERFLMTYLRRSKRYPVDVQLELMGDYSPMRDLGSRFFQDKICYLAQVEWLIALSGGSSAIISFTMPENWSFADAPDSANSVDRALAINLALGPDSYITGGGVCLVTSSIPKDGTYNLIMDLGSMECQEVTSHIGLAANSKIIFLEETSNGWLSKRLDAPHSPSASCATMFKVQAGHISVVTTNPMPVACTWDPVVPIPVSLDLSEQLVEGVAAEPVMIKPMTVDTISNELGFEEDKFPSAWWSIDYH